jgi:hypothetical protein
MLIVFVNNANKTIKKGHICGLLINKIGLLEGP